MSGHHSHHSSHHHHHNQQAANAQPERSVVLATAGFDHTIRLWDAPTGLCHRTIPYTESQVNRLCITPDKLFLAAGGNPHVRLYDVHAATQNPLSSFEGHTNNVTALGFQKDRKWMYTGSEDGSVKIWDLRAPGFQRDYQSKSPVTCVALHPNQGEILTGDEDGNIRVWDLAANTCSYELIPEAGRSKVAIRSLCIAADASIVVAGTNRGTIFVWKVANHVQHIHPAAAQQQQQNTPSPSHASVSSSNANAPQQSSSSSSSSSTASNVAFESLYRFDGHVSYCLTTLLSPDVKYLATTSADKTVKIWNTMETSQTSNSASTSASGSSAAMGHQHSHSAVGAHGNSYGGNTAAGGGAGSGSSSNSSTSTGFKWERTLLGHTAWVYDAAFSADSAYLVTASSDKTAKLWDVKSGAIILDYKGHTKAVTAVALNDSS